MSTFDGRAMAHHGSDGDETNRAKSGERRPEKRVPLPQKEVGPQKLPNPDVERGGTRNKSTGHPYLVYWNE